MPDVQVTNKTGMELKGSFDSKVYVFPAGGSVSVPEKAAEHIFGLTETNKTGALNRLGLLYPARPDRPGRSLEEAQKILDKVHFAAGRTVFDESEPLPPSQPIGDNPDALVAPGGESEAGKPSAADALPPEEEEDYPWRKNPKKGKAGG